jgi:adenylate cyclase
VDELLKNPKMVRLGGEKNILSVLFSDIRGFTSISEKMTAELLVEHLNEYLQAMTDIVIESDGTLDKYVGDEIMAFWGAPIPQEDHALRTCRAAVKMIDVLNELNVNWTALGKPKLDIGIGINTGEMVVGNMGSASRMNYTLMGDNVNLGARLEGTNKVYGTKIIISEFTYEHVKDHVIARELDLIRVKGKALPVKIYELIDMK